MSGYAKLDHLISLLDDESQVVQQAVQKELISIRQDLPERLQLMDRPLTEEEELHLNRLLEPALQADLEETWMRWRWLDNPTAQLEEGVAQVSAYLNGWRTRAADLGKQLDALAETAFTDQGRMDARELAEWLFSPRGEATARFRGNSKDYYSPANSNLFHVLNTGMGNPISLCCLYRLLGQRFGLSIEGCNFPGHFLARVEHDENLWLVDCFNRGRFMLSTDVAKHHPAANPSIEDVVKNAASSDAILLRILRNLDEAFDRINDTQHRQVMRKLAVKLMED